MRAILATIAVLAFVSGLYLLRIVLHSFTDHGHFDVFHLLVGIGSALLGLVVARRALFSRST